MSREIFTVRRCVGCRSKIELLDLVTDLRHVDFRGIAVEGREARREIYSMPKHGNYLGRYTDRFIVSRLAVCFITTQDQKFSAAMASCPRRCPCSCVSTTLAGAVDPCRSQIFPLEPEPFPQWAARGANDVSLTGHTVKSLPRYRPLLQRAQLDPSEVRLRGDKPKT